MCGLTYVRVAALCTSCSLQKYLERRPTALYEAGRSVLKLMKGSKIPRIELNIVHCTRVGTLIVATTRIYLQPIQNRYMFRSFTVLQCSHQHCVQPVASDVEVVGYL